MKVTQLHINDEQIHVAGRAEIIDPLTADLVLVFGDKDQVSKALTYEVLSQRYPNAEIVICSSAGEILGNSIQNGTIVCTAIAFEKTTIQTASVLVTDGHESFSKGKELIEE